MIGRKKRRLRSLVVWFVFFQSQNPLDLTTKNRHSYTGGENCSINTILNQVTTRLVLFVNEIQLREFSLSFSSLNGEKMSSWLPYFYFKCRNYPAPHFPQGSMFTLLESRCLVWTNSRGNTGAVLLIQCFIDNTPVIKCNLGRQNKKTELALQYRAAHWGGLGLPHCKKGADLGGSCRGCVPPSPLRLHEVS